MIELLNFQPFGDHGTMSLLSIRVAHILMGIVVIWLIRGIYKQDNQSRHTSHYNNPNSARNIHLRTQQDKSRGNHYGL